MRAVLYDQFRQLPRVESVADPAPPGNGAVIKVMATGLCRSDWHGWQGHDPDIAVLPHVPGHEFAGVVLEVGRLVEKWRPGDRVTMPFVAGCGDCPECRAGAAQVCDRQFQPGFTGWGSFAEAVAVPHADFNLIRLPSEMGFTSAASLGCRMATAYRAVVLQGQAQPGEWVAVHGSGGVGLSAVMVASAVGARAIAVDVREEPLALARALGAVHVINAAVVDDVPDAIKDLTTRGCHLSLDALGSAKSAADSIRSLRKRGRHVQVGLLAGPEARPRLPMELVIAHELEIFGSHGLAASDYPALLDMAAAGKFQLERLVQRTISLDEAPAALAELEGCSHPGITVVDRF